MLLISGHMPTNTVFTATIVSQVFLIIIHVFKYVKAVKYFSFTLCITKNFSLSINPFY